MKKTSIFTYFAFGHDYAIIGNDGLLGFTSNRAASFLQGFFSKLDELNTPVTYRVASNLRLILKEIQALGDGEKVSSELAARIKKEIVRIDPALDAELQLKEAYILTDKRYSLDYLLNFPENLLAENVFSELSDNAKRDFSAACVQIALAQPTASAFHLMRALEEQVRELYFAYKKTNRMNNLMWGPIIQELRNKRSPRPTGKLLTHLDGMRVNFRNPTQHPQAFYSLDEAQDLLNETISAMNMIRSEIAKKN